MTDITVERPHLGRYPVLLPSWRDPRAHVAVVTVTLQVLGQTVFGFDLSIAQILVAVGTCAAIELAVTFGRSGVIAWPSSAMLTGNGIALILRVPGTEHGDWWSMRGWWIFAGAGAIAMASKYLIRVEGRHVFNPSNFALVIMFIALGEARADPQVLWWGPLSVGLVVAFVVILGGSVAITRRVHQSHSALSFWVAFAAATALLALSGHAITANWHVGPISGWDYWWLLVTSPEILVFLFFMITDPKTAPGGRVAQSIYGTGIALVGALILATQTGEFGTKVGILAALVILCPFVRPIERHTPAARGHDDTLRHWIPATLLAGNRPGASRIRRGAALGVAAVGISLLLVGLGSADDPGAGTVGDLNRRDEVAVDLTALPGVDVEPGVANAAIDLNEETATAMAHDLVVDLAIESAALERADPGLAAAGLTGVRLEQASAAITAGAVRPPSPTREFRTLTASVQRVDGGPQAPPELTVHATGTLTTTDGEEPFDSTFTLVPVDGVHLVANEYDAEGRPVGDQRAGDPEAIEAPTAPRHRAATAEQAARFAFSDVTDAAGLSTPRTDRPRREGPAAVTGGAAVGDYDGDGDPDVFVTRLGLPDVLYRNDGGVFTDVTTPSVAPDGAGDEGSTGAMFVDVDGDGILDLVVLGFGRSSHRVHLGTSAGSFTAADETWALPDGPPGDPDAAVFGLAAADYDRDGDVDLFVAESDPHRIRTSLEDGGVPGGDPCGAAAEEVRGDVGTVPSRTRLLRNSGSGFEDASDRLGIDASSILAVTPRFADIDDDGWDDLLITGQACTTTVLHNDRDGGFVDITAGSGADRIETGIGSELVDVDGDGRLDWFITGVAYPTASGGCPLTDVMLGCAGNRLLVNDGDGTFTDRTDHYGLRDAGWAFAPVGADLNLDGLVDLFTTNGVRNVSTELAESTPDGPLYERSADTADQLWLNTDDAPWAVVEDPGWTPGTNAKAAVPLDYDGDGRTDLLVIDTDVGPRLYRNQSGRTHHWLGVRLVDPASANHHGVGATVTVSLSDGDELVARVGPDGSFQSGRGGTALFGLGEHSPASVTVRWADGSTQVIGEPATDRTLEIERQSR